MTRNVLHIDLETFSATDLPKTGLYRYAEDPSTEILLCAWAVNDGPVLSWGQHLGVPPPPSLIRALDDPNYMKVAHNAPFERALLRNAWGLECAPEQWYCTRVLCLMAGVPGALGLAAEALRLPHQKDVLGGSRLIRLFSMPQKDGTRRNWKTDPEEWQKFSDYCVLDTETERAVFKRLVGSYYRAEDQRDWVLDQKINDRGIAADTDLAKAAIELNEIIQRQLLIEARLLGIKNPKSVAQVKKWLAGNGYAWLETESLSAKTLRALVKTAEPTVKRAMELRLQLSKTSISKYQAILGAVCADGRLRGMHQFWGAQRTGRWSGTLVQVHNLKRNSMKDLDEARRLVKARDWPSLFAKYEDLSDVLSQLIRTAFVAANGAVLRIADFSAIEAVVLAWLANEVWRLKVFQTHGKIYEASASAMFHVPFDTIIKGHANYKWRQYGKIAELALGYGGSVGALIQMGALDMGIQEAELSGLVAAWRQANVAIVQYWYRLEQAFHDALRSGWGSDGSPGNRVVFRKHPTENAILCELPSGRRLVYPAAHYDREKGGLVFWGKYKDSQTFGWQSVYGGKLAENVDQAIARDLLAHALRQLDAKNIPVVLHVHDEAVQETQDDGSTTGVAEMVLAMTQLPAWAAGLPLKAAGYETHYYRKED